MGEAPRLSVGACVGVVCVIHMLCQVLDSIHVRTKFGLHAADFANEAIECILIRVAAAAPSHVGTESLESTVDFIVHAVVSKPHLPSLLRN